MKKLIINADDAGLSDSVNEAVRKLYEAGAITGTSLIAVGRRFQDASKMLKQIGRPEVGAHLTLTGNFHPAQESSRVRSLLTKGETFYSSYLKLLFEYYMKRLVMYEVKIEFEEQIKRILDEGLTITHLDSHEHVHIFPGIFRIIADLAIKFDIPFVRIPLEPSEVKGKDFSLKDLARYTGLRHFTLKAEKIVRSLELNTSDAFFGHFHAGRVNFDVLKFFVEKIKPGVAELAIHPAVMSRELLEESPWHRNAQVEMESVMSEKWREEVSSYGVELVSHKKAFS